MMDLPGLVMVRLICTVIAVLPLLLLPIYWETINNTRRNLAAVATVIWFAVWFAPTANALLSTAWRSAL